jgi:hypothetical protein
MLLNGEGGSDKRQVIIHIIYSKLHFSSKVFLAYVTFLLKFYNPTVNNFEWL